MKDNRLEKEFDEYFKGVNTPDNITGDAKKLIKPKSNFLPRFVKFASVAASLVLVFAVALAIILNTDFKKSPSDGDSMDGQAPGQSDSSADVPRFDLYTDSDLVLTDENAYSISTLDKSLKFIENFALAGNASVGTCTAGYRDGELAIVKAEISLMSGLNRDDTTVFIEFTDTNTVYGELAEYYDGTVHYYYGVNYYLTVTTGENGEPEFKLHILYKGVKYYFNVHSSDEAAYEKYLNLVLQKNY